MKGFATRTALLRALVAALGFTVPVLALDLQITATRQAGSGEGKILYIDFRYRDATGVTASIATAASPDNGATWTVPVQTVSGNTNITATPDWQDGTITWAAGQDWHNQQSNAMMVKVTATTPSEARGRVTPPDGG